MGKTSKLSPEKVAAICRYYEEHKNTPRADMNLKSAAKRIGVGTTTMRSYGNKFGLLNPNRQQFAYGESTSYKKERYQVDPETGCWNWLLNLCSAGYGKDCVNGKMTFAHRASYERAKGPIPKGLHLDHLCRNPQCINPDHLEPVTVATNSRRSPFGKLTEDDVAQIREFISYGERQTPLSHLFNVHPSMISRIASHQRWSEGKGGE